MVTRYGEMMDLISCLSIYEGNAEPVNKITDVQTILRMK